MKFSIDQNLGFLTWTDHVLGGPPELTEAQAAIIASAETAAALRAIASAVYQVAEDIRDASYRAGPVNG